MPRTCGTSVMIQSYPQVHAAASHWRLLIASVGQGIWRLRVRNKVVRARRLVFLDTVITMRVAMMTREYPPEVYGGAGVHVTELVAQLRRLCDVDVHCMGAPRHGAFVHQPDPQLKGANPALTTLSADLSMANGAAGADVAHSHTWYT